MTRMEFLKQLEYLLQDIDEKDREDALAYYMDYMDEAGLSETDIVDGLLDMPEKIAMSIRSSMNSEGEDRSEFSEQGFKDVRVEPERQAPQVYGSDTWKEKEDAWSETRESETWDSEQKTYSEPEVPKNNNIGKYILIGILIILALPVIGGFGAAVVGLLGGIFGVLLACTVGVACAGVGFTVGGVVLFVMSIVRMVTYTAEGLLMMGGSLILIALGILAFMLTAVIFKRFIPWVIRGIVGLFRRIFRRGGEVS